MARRLRKKREETGRKPMRNRLRTDFSHLQEQHPDKCFRLFNNEMGNIQRAMMDGWEVVEGSSYDNVWRPSAKEPSQKGSHISIPVGVGRTENAMDGILLMIDKALFEELQEPLKQHRIEVKESLKAGKGQSEETGVNTYAPNLSSGGKGYQEIRNE